MWHPNFNQCIPSRYFSNDRKQYFDWVQLKWFLVSPEKKGGLLSLILSLGDNKWTDSKLRVTETVVFPDQDIFTHGYVNVSPDGADITLGKKKKAMGSFFISGKGQGKLLKKLIFRKWVIFGVAVSLSLILSNAYLHIPIEEAFGQSSVGGRTPQTIMIQVAVVIAMFAVGALFLKMLRTYNLIYSEPYNKR